MNKNNKIIIKSTILILITVAVISGVIAFLPKILTAASYLVWLAAPFIVSYIISLLVNPMADGLQKRFRLPRGISAILVIVLTVGVLGSILTGVVWKIVDEVRNVYEDFPMIYENIRSTWYGVLEKLSDVVYMLPDNFQNVVDDLSNQVLDWIADVATNTEIVRSAGNIAKKLPNIFISLIVFVLSLYFMVADSHQVSEAVKKPFSEDFLARVTRVKGEIKKYVGGYVRAQLTIMCISFTILLIGLSILKIDYALVIALATAVFDALPFFGSGAVLLPWTAISFIMGDIARGVGVLIIYLIVILMRQLVEPKIVSKNIGMHPILTLIAMYVGYKLLSIGGMILGPLVLVLVVSLYRVGIFDDIIMTIKKLFSKLGRELKRIKSSLYDEGE